MGEGVELAERRWQRKFRYQEDDGEKASERVYGGEAKGAGTWGWSRSQKLTKISKKTHLLKILHVSHLRRQNNVLTFLGSRKIEKFDRFVGRATFSGIEEIPADDGSCPAPIFVFGKSRNPGVLSVLPHGGSLRFYIAPSPHLFHPLASKITFRPGSVQQQADQDLHVTRCESLLRIPSTSGSKVGCGQGRGGPKLVRMRERRRNG
jgi:hypothetical protein